MHESGLYGLLSLSGEGPESVNPEWFELTTFKLTFNGRTYFAHTNYHKIVIVPVPITWAEKGV